jgi:hypothetical protein
MTTEAGKYVIAKARWDEGMRGHFIRMFSITGPQDVEIMVGKIEEEAVANHQASMPYPEDDVREAVAAERARIKVAVLTLPTLDLPTGEYVALESVLDEIGGGTDE